METTRLRELVDATPACTLSTRLEAALSCCGQSRAEQVVIVDEQQHPIGLLRLGRVLLKLAASATATVGAVSVPSFAAIATADLRMAADILEPLRVLPLSTSLAELGLATDRPIALVDQAGCYWGLVDRLRVLQAWADHSAANPLLAAWEKLLDQLPLPLMLQTETGAVLCQNRFWQPNADPAFEQKIAIGGLPATESLWLVAQDSREPQQVARELAAKNADLVQLNRLKDEFLACISHELKSPLTAILGLSNLLKDQSIGTLNDRQLRYARLIHQSGRHLSQIVHNILDLTRSETGQLVLTPEVVPIAPLCSSAYEQARQVVLGEIKADQPVSLDEPTFHLSIAPELDAIVADELRLRQMLTHLLSNALKFSPGGKVTLTVEAWDGWIAFTVADTGIGIATNQQHLIFQKFQQLENPLTRCFAGTGLGLVLTQRLARLHGGEISFTSIEGEGSQFTLLLPSSPPPAPALPSLLSNRLALVVESAPPTIAALTDHLNSLGYRVALARSGPEAIEKTRRLQPGIVLLNPILPLLSGWDVLTLLKANVETQHIPVVVMATQAEKPQAEHRQANGFLKLPIQLAALQQVLQRWQQDAPVPRSNLTILHLRLGQQAHDLSRAVYPCRLIEVDDLDQADLLTRVWRPDAIVLDADEPNTETIAQLTQLSQHSALAALPLVTLTPGLTQAANQISGLSVFPCLARLTKRSESFAERSELGGTTEHPLLQVLHIATGQAWTPRLLLVDLTAVPTVQLLKRLPAIAQYLQAAGFQSVLGFSWAEAAQHLAKESVDALLLWLSPQTRVTPEMTATLMQLQANLPIVLLHDGISTQAAETLAPMAICTLPTATPMGELVAQIHALRNSPGIPHPFVGGDERRVDPAVRCRAD